MISVPEKMTLCDLVDKIHIHIYREDRLLIAEGSVYVFATCAQREWNEMCMCVAVVVKCTKIPHGKGHWERQTQQRWWFLYVAVFFIYECLIVYLPFCSWEMYSFDLVPSSRLNHTSSLLMVVMMALHDTKNNNNVSEQSPPSPLRCQRRVWWLCANTQEDAATKQEAKVKPAL